MTAKIVDILPRSDIPYLYSSIRVSNGDVFPIGRPCYGMHKATVVPIVDDIRSSISIEYLYITSTANGETFAVRRPCHRIPWRGSRRPTPSNASEGKNRSVSGDIPYLCSAVIARRGDARSIGRYIEYSIGMATIDVKWFSIAGIPDLHGTIDAARGDI